MTVTLAKLLKMKNLLVADLNELAMKIQRENKTEGVNVSKYNLKEVYAKYTETINELVKVKTAIARHNTAIVDKIYRMSELKNQINILKQVDGKEGTITRSSYGNTTPLVEVWKVQLGELFIDGEVERLTKEIVELQDELDTHNHVTKIDL